MLKKLLVSLALLAAAPALAQSVQQSGTVTRGHLPYWVTSGVIGDGGTSADSPVTSMGVTNNGGAGFCVSSDRQSAAGRNQLCFGAQTNGAATISLQNLGTAAAQSLCFVVNGTSSCIGTGAGGFVTSSGTLGVGNFPCWSNASGVLSDCTLTTASLVGTTAAGLKAASFTIPGLSARGAPDATNDKLLIYNNSTQTFQYVTPGQIASAATAGVSSLGGVTGAITLGTGLQMSGQQLQNTGLSGPGGTNGQIQYNNSGGLGGFTASGDATVNTSTGAVTLASVNSNIGIFAGACLQLTANGKGLLTSILNGICGINAQTAAYQIATSDCGKIVTESGGPFTVTLPAASGFSSGCKITICNINANDNSHHAVLLSGFPNPFFARLYMMQCGDVVNIAGTTWQASYFPGRFHPAFTPTILIDTGGADTNDGLISNAAGNALRNLSACYAMLQLEYDLSGNIQPLCSPTGGQTFVGSWSIVGPLVGASVINITGNGGAAILQPTASSGFVLQLSDFAPYMISTNITWDCTGGSAGCVDISFHQQSGADLNAGTTLKGNAAGHIGVSCDSMCKINVGASPLNVTGTFNYIATLDQNSILNVNSGLTIAGSTTIAGGLVNAAHNSNTTFAGALTAGSSISIAEIFTLRTGSTGCMNANFTTSGSFGAARQWSVLNNAFFGNPSAVAVPGSTPGISTSATFAAGVVANSGINSGGC